MHLITEKYTDQKNRLPTTGQYIIGQFDTEKIVVYQAYKPSIKQRLPAPDVRYHPLMNASKSDYYPNNQLE